MNATRPLAALIAAAAAAALVGCGSQNTAAATPTSTQQAAPADATDFREPARPGASPAPTVLKVARTDLMDPRIRVAADYAVTSATWTPRTWIAQQVHLKDLATGAALQALTDAQPGPEAQAALQADNASSTATLLAAQLASPPATADRANVVVVLRVAATRSGDPHAADYDIADVTAVREDGHWRIADYAIRP